jgi:hypothetical protein
VVPPWKEKAIDCALRKKKKAAPFRDASNCAKGHSKKMTDLDVYLINFLEEPTNPKYLFP